MPPLLLLGAGASYGSDTVRTPPLGAGLFHALRAFNPDGWGKLPSTMASAFSRDFEKGMLLVAEQNSHMMPILQRAMAAYFFGFSPRATNKYCDLARRILAANWNGALTTLNYERLLEICLIHTGVQPVVAQTPTDGQVELCFPHGCCHIFCDAVQMMAGAVSFSGTAITTDGPVSVVADPATHRARIMHDAVPPVMSYFQPDKHTTAGASFVLAQRARWATLAAGADAIAIVGVRVRPGDEHIWGPVAAAKPPVTYCSGKDAAVEYTRWANDNRAGRADVVLNGYFADEFTEICRVMRL